VRRDRIELSTRGFSVRQENGDPPEKKVGLEMPRGGSGTPTDPDDAVRTAIKAAVEAGRLDLAGKLIEALRQSPAPKPAPVVSIVRPSRRS
jgi:hypothetical protein